MSSLMAPKLADSGWRHCVLRYMYSEPLYQYKRRPTPDRFHPDKTLLAFRIGYDIKSQTTLLELFPPSPGNNIPITETIEFSDTKRHFRYDSTDYICGWYLRDGDIAKNDWNTLRPGLERYGQDQLSLNRKFRKQSIGAQTGCHGIEPLWAIRGYFIGPDTVSSPPYITVLCSDEHLSKCLVDSIHKRRKLWEDWGVTRLPKVRALQYGFGPDSSANRNLPGSEIPATTEEEEEHQLDSIEVRVTDNQLSPTMADGNLSSWAQQWHRCGVRLNVTRGSEVIAKATIGGIIKVGDNLYGLTVAHVFSPLNTFTADHQNDQDEQGGPPMPAAAESASTSGDDTAVILNRWQQGRTSSLEFDWALIEMPGLQMLDQRPDTWDNVNVVQTVSGDFRPVLTQADEPDRNEPVVLATPGSTHCLRGIFIGREAIVNIPDSPEAYDAWVLRMEQPWLVRPGDSGSWAFHARSGNFLGVLIAGCPELQEAYILPAHHILEHIEAQLNRPVSLPNCHPIRKEYQTGLADLVSVYEDTKKNLACLEDFKGLQSLDHFVARWATNQATALANKPTILLNPQYPGGSWNDPLLVLNYQDLLNADETIQSGTIRNIESRNQGVEGIRAHSREEAELPSLSTELCQDTLRQPPLQVYNFINARTRDHTTRVQLSNPDTPYSKKLRCLWRHLILGQTSLSFSDNATLRPPHLTDDRVIEDEINLMTYMEMEDSPRLIPWDRYMLTTGFDEMRETLEAMVSRCKKPIELSLWETQALVLNKHKDRVAVLHAPSYRLPLILGTNTIDEAKNMKQLLTTQLKRDVSDFDELQKIDLGPMHSGCYLVEHNRYIDMVVYEGVLRTGHGELSASTGQNVFSLSKGDAMGILASPFSVAIEKSSAVDRL